MERRVTVTFDWEQMSNLERYPSLCRSRSNSALTVAYGCVCVCYETNVNTKCNEEDTLPSDGG